MKKHNNLIVIFAILIIIGFALTACPQPSSSEDDRIVFWTTMGPPSYDYLKEIVNNYNATKPAMKVKLVQVNDSSTDIGYLKDAIAAGKAPDIYMLDRFTVAQRAAEGILQDLSPHLKMFRMHDYQNFAIEETQFQEKTYAIPFDADIRGLYYNKTMLRQVNLTSVLSVPPSPTDPSTGLPIYNDLVEFMNWTNGPITHEQLKEIAQKIDKKTGSNYTKVGFIPQMDQGNPYTWGYCFGGEFADSDRTQVTPDDPYVVMGFQFISDWYHGASPMAANAGEIQTFLGKYNYTNDSGDYRNHPFIRGDLAMTINGDWFMDAIKEYAPKGFEYGVTYIPVPDPNPNNIQPSTWAGGYAWGIPAGSKNVTEALKFIAYGCGSSGQRIYCKKFSKAPTLYSLSIENGFYAPEHPYFKEVISSAKIRPPLPVGASYWDALCDLQDKIVKGLASDVDLALNEVKTTIQPKLDEILLK